MSESLSAETREALNKIAVTIKLVIDGKRSLEQLGLFNNGQDPFTREFIDPVLIANRAKKKKMKLARKILGNDFLGSRVVAEIFGVKLSLEQIPDIPFSREALIRAKALNQFLVLRIEELVDGMPATMLNLYNLCQSKFEEIGAGQVLYSKIGKGWYNKEGEEQEFFIKQTPKFRWVFVSKEVIENSLNNNYFEQTQTLVDYLLGKVFAGQTIPEEYQQAIDEFDSQKAELKELMEDDNYNRPLVAQRLSELKINQLCRRTPVEAFYDFLIYFLGNKERLLESRCDWTNVLGSNGGLVFFGGADARGALVNDDYPGFSSGNLGVCLARGL